jgi:ferric-dicitrate binding protein FerR (iron transport regulator)
MRATAAICTLSEGLVERAASESRAHAAPDLTVTLQAPDPTSRVTAEGWLELDDGQLGAAVEESAKHHRGRLVARDPIT